MRKELKMTALIAQAFNQNKKPLVEPGFKLLAGVLILYLRDELGVTEYLGYRVQKAYTNEKLALALARLQRIYSFSTYKEKDGEKELGRTFRALFFVAHSTQPELYSDMVEILKKGIDLNKPDYYLEMIKICDANNDGYIDDCFKISVPKEGKAWVKATVKYLNITAEGFGTNKHIAIDEAAEKWILKHNSEKQ